MSRALLRLVPIPYLLMWVVGCGSTYQRADVSGKVLLNGQPVRSPEYMLSFNGADNLPVMVEIDQTGGYQARGVVAGPNRIIVVYRPKDAPPRGSKIPRGSAGAPPAPRAERQPEALPEQYTNIHNTILTYTVEPEGGKFDVVMTVPSAPQP